MAQAARPLISFEEYLRIEADSPIKHEYLNAVVWAMGGGADHHAALSANLIRLIGNQLIDKPCRVYTSDLRVRVRASGLTTYPDASVVCDRVQFDPADPNRTTVLNPKVLVEVTSPSTEKYDRGEKLDHYKRIVSLKEVLLASHRERQVDVWRKTGARWLRHEYRDVVQLASIGCSLLVADIYRDPFNRQVPEAHPDRPAHRVAGVELALRLEVHGAIGRAPPQRVEPERFEVPRFASSWARGSLGLLSLPRVFMLSRCFSVGAGDFFQPRFSGAPTARWRLGRGAARCWP